VNDMTAPATASTPAAEAARFPVVNVGAAPRAAPVRLFALAALWLIGTGLALYLKRTQLLVGFDGGYMLDLAQRQFAWHLPLFSAAMDWFQGLGDVYFAVNFRLLPAFTAASFLANADAAKIVIYEIVLLELSFSIIIFATSLGVSRTAGIAAAALTCLVYLPFARPTLIYPILSLIPHLGSLVAAALLAMAAYLHFGRRDWVADLPFALIMLGLLCWSALVSIILILLAAPFVLLCVVSGVLAAATPAERRRKLALVLATVLLFGSGPGIYLASTILDSAAIVFPTELPNDRASFLFTSILLHRQSIGWVGPVLMLSGIAGAALASLDRSRRTLRIFAITLVIYIAGSLTFAMLIALFDFWRGPAPLYFEFFVVPVYAIFAVVFWGSMLDRLRRALGWSPPDRSTLDLPIVAAAVAAILLLAVATPGGDWGFPYPPKSTAITAILARDSGLQPGAAFRGRTANFTSRSIDQPVEWMDLYHQDLALANATGNELRVMGLHYFDVPGLFQYTQTISPFLYALTTRLLALPGDRQIRSVLTLRRIEPRILAMLGVRYVVTDRPYVGPATLRASMAADDRTLLLYELGQPNVGDYSPTVVTGSGTAAAIIARLSAPDFDPRHEVIADLPEPESGLVPARDVRLTFDGASLKLEAESEGRSILLLPLEFSRCLVAAGTGGVKPLLFRADLLETGVLFSGRLDVELSIRTGAFLHPACRLEDYFDAGKLGVGNIPQPR